jgi:hypothetical protein
MDLCLITRTSKKSIWATKCFVVGRVRKIAKSDLASSVRMEQLGSHWKDIDEI